MTQISTAGSPYYDDFDATKGFHQILFKPSLSVQARELTQLQSILRDQIAKFGGHMFRHGSVVIPGNSTSDLSLCAVTLNTTAFDVSSLVGSDIICVGTGLRAKIRHAVNQGVSPAKLYVSYYNTGSGGQQVFSAAESLTVGGVGTTFTVSSVSGASMAFINRGVYFVNGTFVTVNPQSVVLSDSATPSCHVLLKIVESVVTSNDDETLYDPAQGSSNYSAPGADRLKIELELVTLPIDSTFGEDYVEIMRFKEGVLEEHSRFPKYNELEKSLARRTYDESGDYIVSGLKIAPREHLKIDLNNGRYDAPTGDASKMLYVVKAGKAYIHGFENELISDRELIVDKARGVTHVSTISANMVPNFGQFIYVSELVSLPDFKNREVVTFNDAKTGGASIGSARVIAIDFHESNTTDNNAIYKLFISDVAMTGGNSVASIGNITFTGGSATVVHLLSVSPTASTDFALAEVATAGTRAATVHKFTRSTGDLYVFKHATATAIPTVADSLTAPSTAAAKVTAVVSLGRNADDNMLIQLPSDSTYRVKDATNAPDISYKIYYTATVAITGGNGSFSVSGMAVDPKEQGNFIITSAAGVHPLSTATVSGDGLTVNFTGITPTSTTLKVVCACTKIDAGGAPKTKTLVTSHSQSGLTPSTSVQLEMADVVRIRSITSTVDGDVTERFKLDNGQRDYAYLRGSLTLSGTLPTGTLTVVYDYFNHNAGSGDYFSIDSYESSGLTSYYDSTIYNYVSSNTGKTIDLRDVLDFRPRVGTDGTFTGTGNSTNYAPQVASRITTSLQKYVGRIDVVVMGKDGALSVIRGTPSATPSVPAVSDDVLAIAKINVPPYTFGASDVQIIDLNNRVYTMKDVGSIDKRLQSVEDVVMLSAAETSAVNMDIIDSATGLSRYKSGYLVDTFNNADKISAIDDAQFKVVYESEKIIPVFETAHMALSQVSSTAQTTGNVVTAPYTHVKFAAQPVSSRVTNVNPFAVFAWTGDMTLVPSSDNWAIVQNLPTNYTSSSETITVVRPWGGGEFGWGGL